MPLKWKRAAAMALAAVCLVCGFSMAGRVFGQFRENIIAQHQAKLSDIADSVDRSAMGYLQIYRHTLEYITGRRGFAKAEAIWAETGDIEELVVRMKDNLLSQNMQIQALLAMDGAEVIVSTDGSTGYQVPPEDDGIFLCRDPEGNICLGISHRTERLSYTAVLQPGELCSYFAEGSAVSDTALMLLVDPNGSAAIRYQSGVTTVQVLTQELLSQAPVLALVHGAAASPERQTGVLELGDMTRGYVLIGSGGSRNGFFTVCILDEYDVYLSGLEWATIWLALSCLMIAGGVGLLVLYAGSLTRENRRAAAELEQLKERQAALEQINLHSQQLAHHQRLQTIGTLTSSISHEFNNLLTPIMSYSLLTLEKLPAEEEELYDNVLEIYNASKKAKTIISRLSDLSRKNSPRTFQPLSPDELVQKALDIAMPAKPEGVEVKLDLNCWDLRIRANEIQICQMLLNLILNAFQAMEGGGTLHIGTTFDDDRVHMRICDNGCGIPPELQSRIFDPFFTTKEPGKGTGLGLAIAAQVAEDHKGTIAVESEPGIGTRFRVSLPKELEIA